MDNFLSTDEILCALNVIYPNKVCVIHTTQEDYERTETNNLKFFNETAVVNNIKKRNYSLIRKAQDPTFQVNVKLNNKKVIIKGSSTKDTYTFFTTSIAKKVYELLYFNGF